MKNWNIHNQPQPATPMQTDNNIASGIINGTFNHQARSKAIDIDEILLANEQSSTKTI